MTWNRTLVPALLALASLGQAQESSWYARSVVAYSNLGTGIYGDPTATLGPPSRWVRDTQNGGPNQQVAPSIGYASWNVSPTGQPLLCTIRPGGFITLRFHPPIQDSEANLFGQDFIVFGNSVLMCSESLTWNTNLNLANVLAGPDWTEPMAVSVSPDGIRWYTYPNSVTSGADGLWPTQAFQWDGNTESWGEKSDFTRPVPPSLTRSQLTGQTVASAIQLFQGSGGGTAFDLRPSGFRSIRFIRVDGNGGELDAIARVSRAIEMVPSTSPN